MSSLYPTNPEQRDHWIVTQRPTRNTLDPLRPYAFLIEEEPTATKEIVQIATVFLTNRECPFRCAMCDLWKNTLPTTVPLGAIPAQIKHALSQLPPARHIKLYNAGSFFDPHAIPPEDYDAIAAQIAHFERVIVECHPSLVGQSCLEFANKLRQHHHNQHNEACHPERSPSRPHREGRSRRTCGSLPDPLQPKLEVAMGLETAHPQVLAQLNKRMTLDQFKRAADFLQQNEIDLRVFILVQPPFMREDESIEWAARSLDFAFDCGATAATLIPTRGGNGAMEHLQSTGEFSPPKLATLEAAAAYGLTLNRGRVFTDLWDIQPTCANCGKARIERLRRMNLEQKLLPPASCILCEARS